MENRKTQIIDLALKLIQQKGYVAFSYDDISKLLNVTKASIHYHFEKKEDLGAAVVERLIQSLQNFSSTVEGSSLTAEEKLQQFIQKRAERIKCTEICPISSLQKDFESLPDIVRQKVEEVSRLELSIIHDIVDEAQSTGIVSDLENVQLLSITILSSIKGALLYRRVLGDEILNEVLIQINRFFKK